VKKTWKRDCWSSLFSRCFLIRRERERLTDKTFRDLGDDDDDDGISLGEKLSFFPRLSFDLGNTNKAWHILFGEV